MPGKFVSAADVRREELSWGSLAWFSGPAVSHAKELVVLELTLASGGGHNFHKHPSQEEVIYVIEGEIEQWIDREKRLLRVHVGRRVRDRDVVGGAAKIEGGVQRSSSAPRIPPARLGTVSASSRGSAVRTSRRYPSRPPSDPGQIATVLVAFAVTEFRPSQTRVGNEIRVPPPATAFIAANTR